MTEENKNQCTCNIDQKKPPMSRGEESPLRDKKCPEVKVHDEQEVCATA